MSIPRVLKRSRPGGGAGPQAGGSLPAPNAVELARDCLRVGDRWQRTLAITGYPREVQPGWLAPLLRAAGELDLTLHIAPVSATVAAERLRRQRARLESSRRLESDRGRLSDPTLTAAAQDAHELAGRLARGESRLLSSGLYLSITAASRRELEQRTEQARGLCASMLLHTVPATFRPLDGWLSSLPLGIDRLAVSRTFNTQALAAAYPFASSDPPLESDGVLYGLTAAGTPMIVDRFAHANFNSVLLADSGAGKSYAAKLEALRLAYRQVQVLIIDPEDEYRPVCEALGGTHLSLAGPHAASINPLDLPGGGGPDAPAEGEPDALSERIIFLADLVEVLAGGLSGGELAALDRAAHAAYENAGITADPRTHSRPAPLLADLTDALGGDGAAGAGLAERLYPYAHGAHSSLFARPSSVRPDGHVVCYSLRGVQERLRPAALMLCLDAIWRCLEGPLRRRMVIVDEAWELMAEQSIPGRQPPGARFLYALAKKARKRWTALTTLTQDPGDLLDSPLGQAVVNNARQQLLLGQSAQAIDRVGDAFGLTAGERRYLLSCPVGHGLLIAGQQRIPLQIKASEAEDRLISTSPERLAAREHASAGAQSELDGEPGEGQASP